MKYVGFTYSDFLITGLQAVRREHFRIIKAWGFNTILLPIWWHEFEPKKEEVGVYNEENLRIFGEVSDMAIQEGLKVILSGRVCYDNVNMPPWAGWSTHDYVNLTEEGLQRYIALWKLIIQRFPKCEYCLWHCPYHMQAVDENRKSRFEIYTLPKIVQAARSHTNKELIVCPIWSGYLGGRESGWYETGSPLEDDNIRYGVGHTLPYDITVGSHWDYDPASVEADFAGMKRFTGMGLPMISIEFAPIEWKSGEVIHQSRLDRLNESVKRMEEYDAGYAYWRISLFQEEGDNILRDIPSFTPVQEILDVIKPEGNGNGDEFPWKWIALTLGVVAIIYFTTK